MSAKRVAVDLYYDVVSPYSWIQFEMLCRYRTEWQSMSLKFRPFLLGAVLKGSGNNPPINVPNKAQYMPQDIKRLGNYYKIPIVIPDNFVEVAFKKTTLNAMRFITAIDLITKGVSTEEISRQLWKKIFVSHTDASLPDSFREAAKSANIDEEVVEKAIKLMEQKEAKDALRETTEEAIGYGAFGAPSTVVHLPSGPQMIFGCDRLEIISSLLGEKYNGALHKKSRL